MVVWDLLKEGRVVLKIDQGLAQGPCQDDDVNLPMGDISIGKVVLFPLRRVEEYFDVGNIVTRQHPSLALSGGVVLLIPPPWPIWTSRQFMTT